MPDSDADDGSNLTAVRGQSIDVRALQAELARPRGENARLRAALGGTRDGAAVATLSHGELDRSDMKLQGKGHGATRKPTARLL